MTARNLVMAGHGQDGIKEGAAMAGKRNRWWRTRWQCEPSIKKTAREGLSFTAVGCWWGLGCVKESQR